MKEEDKARYVIVAKTVNNVESMFVAYEDDGAQHVIAVIVSKLVDKIWHAVVVQTKTRLST